MHETLTLNIELPDGNEQVHPSEEDALLPLSTLLRSCDIALNACCGELGYCNGCRVTLTGGQLIHRHSGEVVQVDLPV